MKTGKLYQNRIWLAFSLLLLTVLLIPSVFTACAQPATITDEASKGLQTVQPEEVGLSSEKLNDIDTLIQADIAANKIPGAVLLIARHGKVAYFKSFGYQDNDKQLPMEKDSIFRVYSMTKSLTAVGTAILRDEGKLAFDDPVEKYIPAFKDVQVGEVTKDEAGKYVVTMVKPTTIMTIQHLATHTSGLSGMLGPKQGITELYAQAGMNNTSGLTNAEVADKLAKLPLAENPGTLYRYGSSYDVLGRVIEVASGMTLDKFFEESIYKPLGMKDSGFRVTGEDINRLVYLNPQWPFYIDINDPNRKLLSASGGTVSTANDWAQFAQMLLNGGELEGKRLLKSETVTYITSDLIGPLGDRSDAAYIPGAGYGEGFDFYVRTDTSNLDYPANIGTFMKEGIAGTTFSVDPTDDLLAVFMVSTTTQRQYYRNVIEKMIYQSIID
jgi:CubicO group peptidase (beta-lactamase class C family)